MLFWVFWGLHVLSLFASALMFLWMQLFIFPSFKEIYSEMGILRPGSVTWFFFSLHPVVLFFMGAGIACGDFFFLKSKVKPDTKKPLIVAGSVILTALMILLLFILPGLLALFLYLPLFEVYPFL